MIFSRYTLKAYGTRVLILIIDIFITLFCIGLAIYLRSDFNFSLDNILVKSTVLSIFIIRIISFKWFKTYSVIVRFAGISDVVKIIYALSGGLIFLLSFSFLLRPYGYNISFSILFIEFFLALCLLSGFRIFMPTIFNYFFEERQLKTDVVVFGAGQLGAITCKAIKQDSIYDYNIVGIFDDNPDLQSKSLDGIPVYKVEELPEVVKHRNVEKAIIAIENLSLKRKNEFVDLCLANDLKVLQVPFTSNWSKGQLRVDQIKEIKIEDLLNRPIITLNESNLVNQIQNKRILVTGAAGSIGSELVKQILLYKPEQLVIVDQAETPLVNLGLEIKEVYKFVKVIPILADITDFKRMQSIFQNHKPQIVFHAAAYKHVPIVEQYPREAIRVNIFGTKNVADVANSFGVEKFVMISTDKAVNPTNVMGATKRVAELYVQSLDPISNTQFIITRFGNVLGSNGSVVPRFKKQIAKGGPVTVTHPDITRYFMTIPEASRLVLEAGTIGNGGELFLFDMGEPVKILDLANKMIKLSGLVPDQDIEINFTGLREGEKLIEELLATKENSIQTHNPKIKKARGEYISNSDLDKQFLSLRELLENDDNLKLVKCLKRIVPEYKSNNSVYSQIDKEFEKENKIRRLNKA